MPAALESLGDVARRRPIEVDVPETLPRVDTDPALVERALVNLVANAVAWSPDGLAGPHRGRRGRPRPPHPGRRPRARRARPPTATASSSRSSGSATGRTAPGVGLGLAVARGFVEAVGGELDRRGHAGRRHDDGHHAPAPDPGRTGRGGAGVSDARRSGARRRRRAADPPGARHQPQGPRLRGRPGRPRARRRSTSRPATTPTSSCSTSASPASTASR